MSIDLPPTASNEAERLFDAGWVQAARWADRDDLLADMDSGTYKANRSVLIADVAPTVHVACQSGAVIVEEGE